MKLSASAAERRAARIAALEALYSVAVGQGSVADALAQTEERSGLSGDGVAFFRGLVARCAGDFARAEARFAAFLAEGWTLERLALTDRLLLCLACEELWSCPDVPPKVTLAEYVGLAKRYGTAESGRFVNGVLGSVLPTSPKAAWNPVPDADAEPEPPGARPPDPLAPEVGAEGGTTCDTVRVGHWVIRTREADPGD